jgi:hypothetical protein
MVERVKITPSQILLKDADGNVKFNSNTYYLKTGSGTLYAGGYDRAPAIYGQNSVYDHTEFGGYCSGLLSGAFHPVEDWSYYTNVPKSSNGNVFKYVPSGGTLVDTVPFRSPNLRYVKYYNYDTKVLSDTYVYFYWAINRWGYGDNGDGGYATIQWEAYPELSDYTLPAVTNPNGGTFEFFYTANEYRNWSRTLSGYDPETGQSYSNTQYGRDVYAERSSYDYETGQTYTIAASPVYFRRSGIFNTRNPIALSLAVTP